MEELVEYTALEQASLIRDREVSAEELLDAHLERVEERDSELNAFVQLFDRWARRDARRIDTKRSAWPDPLPAFWGVPFAIKDSDLMRFTRTRLGSNAFKWVVSPIDGPAVKRLRAAGFVMMGKTATSEFALMPVVDGVASASEQCEAFARCKFFRRRVLGEWLGVGDVLHREVRKRARADVVRPRLVHLGNAGVPKAAARWNASSPWWFGA